MFGVPPPPGDVGSLFGMRGSGLELPASCAPALSTILVEPGCQAEVTETGDIRISVGAEAPSTVGAQLDPIHLSIFSHRFMSIAGECPPQWPCSLWSIWECAHCAEVGTGCVAAGVCRGRTACPGGGSCSGTPAGDRMGSVAPALGWPAPPCQH